MKHLVDANVLSEATKPDPNVQVVEWLRSDERSLVIDPVILVLRSARRKRLERWFDEGIRRIDCLPWNTVVGLRWTQLLAELRRRGRPMSIKDSLIAATALANDLAVATLNGRDFEPAGVTLVDPSA